MLHLAPVAQLLHQVLDAAYTLRLDVLPLKVLAIPLYVSVCPLLLTLPLLPLALLPTPLYIWVCLLLLSLPLLRFCLQDCVSPWLLPMHLLLFRCRAAAAACLVR
jgi:hypothetical protein